MRKIAVLIPTYKRPQKLRELIESFYANSSVAQLYFIVEPDDLETHKELELLFIENPDFKIIIFRGEYVNAINAGVNFTNEPFVFCGADDILFSPNWDKKLLRIMKCKSVGVTGGIDDWACSRSGVHISHPLVRREYIQNGSYWQSEGKYLYCPEYKHYQCDIELEQLAWTKGVFKLCNEVTIAHNHYVNHKSEDDETYQRSRKNLKVDTAVYDKRKMAFESWDLNQLYLGNAVESEFARMTLSIVMPIWNCEKYVRSTLASLIKQTKNKYELIMIDDRSTEFDGAELLKELKEIAYAGGFTKVIAEVNKEQKYANANWNRGVELATGRYIAIINSDIDFLTEEWDDFLIENINLGYELVSPYQLDRIYHERAYAKPPMPNVQNFLDIRGACYMMSEKFAKNTFPIPSQFVHWCGDNYLASSTGDTMFDIRVQIYHHISKSGEKVNQKVFWNIVKKDVENWIDYSGDIAAKLILKNCEKRLEQWK